MKVTYQQALALETARLNAPGQGPTAEQIAQATAMKGKRCLVTHTGYEGVVLGPNLRETGFYPGGRYPVVVRIDEASDGGQYTFEYGLDQVNVDVDQEPPEQRGLRVLEPFNGNLFQFLGIENFSYKNYFKEERERMVPAFQKLGFTDANFFSTDSDSLGPLARSVYVSKDGKPVHVNTDDGFAMISRKFEPEQDGWIENVLYPDDFHHPDGSPDACSRQ